MWRAGSRCSAAPGLPRDGNECSDGVSTPTIYPAAVLNTVPASLLRRVLRVCADIRCTQCSGKGVRITRLCGTCNGNKVIQIQHNLAVHIPAGAPENFEEVFSGEADESMDWEAGDVIVRVKSRRTEGDGGWGRKDGGVLGRVTLSVAEVSE